MLLDPAGAEVRADTGVVVAMIPVLVDHVGAGALVSIAVARDGALLLKTCTKGVGGAALVIPEMAADVNTSVVALRVADAEVLLLEAAVDADVEGLVPSALLVNAVFVDIEGSEGSGLATLAVLEVDVDELPESAGTAVLVGAGADMAMIPMVIGNAGACKRMPSEVADAEDDASLLKTFVHGVGQTVPGILEVSEHVNTRVAF